jgi:hypothetical protein
METNFLFPIGIVRPQTKILLPIFLSMRCHEQDKSQSRLRRPSKSGLQALIDPFYRWNSGSEAPFQSFYATHVTISINNIVSEVPQIIHLRLPSDPTSLMVPVFNGLRTVARAFQISRNQDRHHSHCESGPTYWLRRKEISTLTPSPSSLSSLPSPLLKKSSYISKVGPL